MILSNRAEPLPTGQVWQRQRVGTLPGRNNERRTNSEEFGIVTIKSNMEREEMKTRGCSPTGKKRKDQWNGCPDKAEKSLGQT